MAKTQSLVFAALLMTSATAFAADTPDPSTKGEAALPSVSNTNAPPSEAPANKGPDAAGQGKANPDATATTPGEENKGRPPVAPE